MSISLHEGVITLSGECLLEEAEALSNMLSAETIRMVDIGQATHLHAAVFQLLLMHAKIVSGISTDEFVGRWLNPALLAATNV